MTAAATVPRTSRSRRGRWQGALAIASLGAAVLGTVALVAVPPSSASSRGSAETARALLLPRGLRVQVQGGPPHLAHRVADRLQAAGASVAAVRPAVIADDVAATTTIEYHDRESLADADRIRAMLGRGTLRRRQVFQPVADVTIVLGKDLARL